ncbi:MAG: hypothetical protein WCX48_05910 [Bacteroidales bacterium]
MKKYDLKYIALAISLFSIICVFLPWVTTTLDHSSIKFDMGIEFPKIHETGISWPEGVTALFVCFFGSVLTFKENKYSYISGIVNVILGIMVGIDISSVNEKISGVLGSSSVAGYGLVLFLLGQLGFIFISYNFTTVRQK